MGACVLVRGGTACKCLIDALQINRSCGVCAAAPQFGKVVYYDTSEQRTDVRNPYYIAAYNAVEVPHASGWHPACLHVCPPKTTAQGPCPTAAHFVFTKPRVPRVLEGQACLTMPCDLHIWNSQGSMRMLQQLFMHAYSLARARIGSLM